MNDISYLWFYNNKKVGTWLTDIIRYASGGISNWAFVLPQPGKLNAIGLKYFLTSYTLLKGLFPDQHRGRVWSSGASCIGFPANSFVNYIWKTNERPVLNNVQVFSHIVWCYWHCCGNGLCILKCLKLEAVMKIALNWPKKLVLDKCWSWSKCKNSQCQKQLKDFQTQSSSLQKRVQLALLSNVCWEKSQINKKKYEYHYLNVENIKCGSDLWRSTYWSFDDIGVQANRDES